MLIFYLNAINDINEKDKFEQLYNLYKQTMYNVAFSILHNQFDAEDAVHEAFLKISKNIIKISDVECPQTKAFVVIIIKNTAINIYNKNKKISEHTTPAGQVELNVGKDLITETTNYNELVRTIKSLPQTDKDIIYLRFIMGYSVNEISIMLNISHEAVKKRVQRAKNLCEKTLNRGKYE